MIRDPVVAGPRSVCTVPSRAGALPVKKLMMHAVPSHDTMVAPVFLTPRLGVGRPRVSASRTEYALTTESMPILLPSLGWQGLVALDRPRSRPTAALDIGCCAAVVADIGVGGLLLRRRRDGLPMTSPDVGWQVPNRSMSVPPPNRSATRRTTSACADCAPAMPREAMLNVPVLSLSMRRDVAAAVMPVGPTSTRDAGRPQASAARTEFALATESMPNLLPIRGLRGLVALDRLRRRPAVVPDIGCCAAAEADDVAGGLLLRRSCDGPPMASTDAGWRVPIRSMSVPLPFAPAPHLSRVAAVLSVALSRTMDPPATEVRPSPTRMATEPSDPAVGGAPAAEEGTATRPPLRGPSAARTFAEASPS